MKNLISKWTDNVLGYMLLFLLIGGIVLMNIALIADAYYAFTTFQMEHFGYSLKRAFKASFVLLFLDGFLFFAIVLWVGDIMDRRIKKKSSVPVKRRKK